ncbi:MAG: hypothetical protein Q4A17_12235 [Thermoguttaceae bacterium]|nr:hypothetical protein [Thermoguttaceae bacterium]
MFHAAGSALKREQKAQNARVKKRFKWDFMAGSWERGKMWGRRFQRRLMECGNTEAEGFLCRFHLAAEKCSGENGFSHGKDPARFSGKRLFEAELPQGKAVNVACATVSPHSR